jgi:polysaccharide export outer membrane protein
MIAKTARAAALVALLAASAVCVAQTSPAFTTVGTASIGEPIDPRIGAFRPATPAPVQGPDAGGQTPPSAQNLAAPIVSLGKEYRIGPNDLLEIDVPDLERERDRWDSPKRTVRVNAAGAISLPLIGAVVVAGLTALQAEGHIAERYSEKYLQNPQVSIFIKEFTTERITLDGAVVKPGIYPLMGEITLLRALALAGGFGPIADSNEVMLFRDNAQGVRQFAVFDVDKIRAGKTDDPAIKGGDLIVVQRDANRKMLKDSIFRDVLDSINPFSIFR